MTSCFRTTEDGTGALKSYRESPFVDESHLVAFVEDLNEARLLCPSLHCSRYLLFSNYGSQFFILLLHFKSTHRIGNFRKKIWIHLQST